MKTLLRLIFAGSVAMASSPIAFGQISSTFSRRNVTGAAIAVKHYAARAEVKAVAVSNHISTVLVPKTSTRTVINHLSNPRRVAGHQLWISMPILARDRNSLGVGVTINSNSTQRAGGGVRAPPAPSL